ncbi:MAG: cytochrome b N-terminal domain-containing protein [Acidobacteriota bacterium]
MFGSVALFALLIQIFTGLLLALNYGATPSEAHASVRFIMTELTGGSMIRGLHHWGASAMIIVVAVHMLQTFLWGAYKKPREATWMIGCVLLLLTMAFGLTGYLLPWGQPRVLGHGGNDADRGDWLQAQGRMCSVYWGRMRIASASLRSRVFIRRTLCCCR